MTDFNETVILDGVNDFSIFGRDFSFDGGFIDRLRVRLQDGDTGTAELVLTGDGWDIETAKFNGEPAFDVTMRDEGEGDRFVNLIRLPDGNSVIDLPFTKVNFIRGSGEGASTITLGQFVNYIELRDADDTVTVSGGARLIDLAGGDNTLRITDRFVDSVLMRPGNNTVVVEEGGSFDTLRFSSGSNVVRFDGDKFAASITAFSDEEDVNEFILTGAAKLRSLGVSNGRDTLVVDSGSTIEQAQLGNNDDDVTIRSGARIDSLQIGNGNDILRIEGGEANQVIAYGGDDTVTLTDGGRIQSLALGDGNNRVELDGGSTVDQLQTFGGDDTVLTTEGRVDVMTLGAGANVVVTADRFVNGVFAYDGDDDVTIGSGGAGMVKLDHGANTIEALGFVDAVVTFDGDDVVTIRDGARSLALGDGDNQVTTRGYVGSITLGAGDDTVNSRSGGNSVDLGDGDNRYFNLNYVDAVRSGEGDDFVTVGGGAAVVSTGDGDDHLRVGLNSIAKVISGEGDDLIEVGLLSRGEFLDIDGRDGFDTIVMTRVGGDLDVDLRRDAQDQGDNGRYVLHGIEAVVGGRGADRIAGDSADNRFTGNAGEDVFIFDKAGGVDVITDFTLGEDLVRLEQVRSASEVRILATPDGALLQYYETEILFEGIGRAQLAHIDNFEL